MNKTEYPTIIKYPFIQWGPQIFGRVWALWGLIIFLLTLGIVFIFYLPCFLIAEPYAAQWHRAVSRVWMTIFLNLIGCPLKVTGTAVFKPGHNYIIVCNHNSLMDVPVTTPFMPNANKTIAKKEFSYIPIFGWIYSLGSVLVDRKNDQSRRKSYEKMKEVLRIGLDMVIYPEGTRNRTNEPLKSFYDGAFKLSTDTQKAIVPALIFNTKEVLPANKIFFLMPHKLKLHFLQPVEPLSLSSKALKEKVYKLMFEYYASHQ